MPNEEVMSIAVVNFILALASDVYEPTMLEENESGGELCAFLVFAV